MTIRSIGFVFCFFCLYGQLSAQQQGTPSNPTRGWLTVETIMRDPVWMGVSPGNITWSENGEWIYFTWRQQGDAGDSLYVVSAKGGTPRRVPMEERKKLPSAFGDYTGDQMKKVYAKSGDLFLLDIKRNAEAQLTHTVAAESTPRFSFDEKKISFQRDGNLFLRHLASGAEVQMTNLQH